MNFNQTDIGLLLFYIAGAMMVIILFLAALPSILERRPTSSKLRPAR